MSELKAVFQEIDAALNEDPSRAKGVEAVYQFYLDGEAYQLVLKGNEGYATVGEDEDPDCTLKMSQEDFIKMVEGNLNGTQAFMSGRLKIKGNMGLALKLQDILATYRQSA
ncbi:SCP2 sterol-binding domain-containing protein [Piscibacillus salipiscarius]|uniref:SCP2 sterol-binding domain-containing protein n=1 Tax=Piscibacillus salipiscarius TaxID=299480 RepID=A0ABW5QC21_9BACI|nr:SCP2 sterol-binding domain-containing protein [Piscibacillus salipiscarius]